MNRTSKKTFGFLLTTLLAIAVIISGCSLNNGNGGASSPAASSGSPTASANPSASNAAGGEETVDVLRYPLTLTFASLDPHLVPTGGVANIDRHIYEQLVAFNTKYEPKPVLATEIQVSEDGKTYTFPLRKGVKFHNGKELKAEDVVASLNRWKEKTARVQTSFGDALFKEVDEYTVAITLAQPSNDVPLQLASYLQFSAITTKEAIESAGPDGLTEIIGTGPYKYVEYKQDQYVHLTRFDDYVSPEGPQDGVIGKKEALVKDVYFDLIPDGSTAFNAFLAGDYDFASVTVDNLPQVQSLSDVTLNKVFAGELNIVFNKKAPFPSNVKFREAIAAALDAEQVLAGYTSDPELYRLNSSLVTPDNAEWHSEAGAEKYNQKNPELAKQLLQESGYNGEELVFLTTRDSAGAFYNATVLVVDQLQKIGINAKIDTYDFTTMIARRGDPAAWDIYVGSFSNQASPSQVLFLGKSYGWPEDEQLQQLIRNTTEALTPEAKKQASDALHAYHWNYLGAVKIGDTGTYYANRNNVVGYQFFEGPILWNTKVLKK
jgi:peptide/nickel transport system substrate-binding protein